LHQVLKDLHRAFTNFFENRARSPKFKSRKRDRARFRIPQRVKTKDGGVIVPEIGDVQTFQSQDVTEETKSTTFKRGADGKWYVSLVVEFEMPDIPIPMPDPAKTVGIDVELIDHATFSDTTPPVPAPEFFRKGQSKLRKAQRTVSRRQEGMPLEPQALHPGRPLFLFVQAAQRVWCDQRPPHALGSGVGLRLHDAPSEGLPRRVRYPGRRLANARRRAGRRASTLRETV
jgi:hypothetical protein